MSFSLNEAEVSAKKAARGAGYSWGLAEEAGKAVRWLCAHGLDGCAVLAPVLTRFDGCALAQIAPQVDGPEWRARGAMLCPLVTGAALSDRAADLEQGVFSIGPIAAPHLILPFAAYLARTGKCSVHVEWAGGSALLEADRLSLSGEAKPTTDHLSVGRGGNLQIPTQRCTRAEPEMAAWQTLQEFAHRTYAPATEESRLKGAGAEMSGTG